MKDIPAVFRVIAAALIFVMPAVQAKTPTIKQLVKKPEITQVRISPGGDYLAMKILDEDHHSLRFLKRRGMEPLGGIDVDLGQGRSEVGNYWWVNDKRIIGEVDQILRHREEPISIGELFAVNFDGSNSKLLFGLRSDDSSLMASTSNRKGDLSWGQFIDSYPADPDRVIIAEKKINQELDEIPVARLLDVNTGSKSRQILGRAQYPQANFLVDEDGIVRVIASFDEDRESYVRIRQTQEADWTDLPADRFGPGIELLTVSNEGEFFYYLDNSETDTKGLFQYSFDSGKSKKIYTSDTVDIFDVRRSTDGRGIYAIRLYDGYPRYLLLNSEMPERDIFKQLLATFPGYLVEITSRSEDGRYWVIYTHADTDPGTYYLFDQKEMSVGMLFRSRPELADAELAPMEPVSFKSVDDREIHGYLTRAINTKDKKPPMVVLVHGGPRARDFWGFDPWVQSLATQGISVLQVNFRGSLGFGREHLHAGDRQWGDRVQQDIIAGTKWAISEGIADSKRTCIAGASFGGYSAMMSAVLEPDLFSCIVAVAGIYDLELLFNSGDIHKYYGGQSFLHESLGDDKAQLQQYSPVHHVSRIKSPVLIVHGEKDIRAPFRHALALEEALEKSGKDFETYYEKREAHGFYNTDNQEKFLTEVLAFVKKHTR